MKVDSIMIAEGDNESPGEVKLERIASSSDSGITPDSYAVSVNDIDDADEMLIKESNSWVRKTASKLFEYVKTKLGISDSGDTNTFLNAHGDFASINMPLLIKEINGVMFDRTNHCVSIGSDSGKGMLLLAPYNAVEILLVLSGNCECKYGWCAPEATLSTVMTNDSLRGQTSVSSATASGDRSHLLRRANGNYSSKYSMIYIMPSSFQPESLKVMSIQIVTWL